MKENWFELWVDDKENIADTMVRTCVPTLMPVTTISGTASASSVRLSTPIRRRSMTS